MSQPASGSRRAASAIARNGAATETSPRPLRKARSSGVASRWISAKERSPPRIARPSRASPSTRPWANEPTPAIAVTPSAMQAMKTPKPRTPPRNSRNARRSGTQRSGRATVVEVTPSPHGLRHEAAKQEMHRRVKQERQEHDQARHPGGGRHPCLRNSIAHAPDIVDVDRREPGIGPRRRHEEEADQHQDPRQDGPGRKAAAGMAPQPPAKAVENRPTAQGQLLDTTDQRISRSAAV